MHNKKRNRKGFFISYWVLIEGLLISIAIVATFQYINGVKNDTLFEQKYFARDLALMADTVSTVPGDVTYTYSDSKADLSAYEYHFTKNLVEIKESGKDLSVTYPFYYDNSLSPNFQSILKPDQIVFSKKGASLDISKTSGKKPAAELCPAIDTKGTLNIISVDSSDGAWDMADRLYKRFLAMPNAGFQLSLTRQQDPTALEDRLDKISGTTDAVVSFDVSDQDVIHVYASKNSFQDSDKLACLIINNLKDEFQSVPAYRLESEEKIINKHGVGVKVVVKNDKAPDRVTAAVLDALREYNG